MARMTHHTLLVLRALMARPGREMYGRQVMRALGLTSGTVYPMLTAAEEAGWVTSRAESGPVRGRVGRLRRYYRITAAGESAARTAIRRENGVMAALGLTVPEDLRVAGTRVPVVTDSRQPPGVAGVISGGSVGASRVD
jgi:DNA-binding PadR family transcriptional regulator